MRCACAVSSCAAEVSSYCTQSKSTLFCQVLLLLRIYVHRQMFMSWLVMIACTEHFREHVCSVSDTRCERRVRAHIVQDMYVQMHTELHYACNITCSVQTGYDRDREQSWQAQGLSGLQTKRSQTAGPPNVFETTQRRETSPQFSSPQPVGHSSVPATLVCKPFETSHPPTDPTRLSD